MALTLKDIHGKLAAKFSEKVFDWLEPEAGDGWIEIEPLAWAEIAAHLKADPDLQFDYLRMISGVDYSDHIQVVYHLMSYARDHDCVIKVKLERKDPRVASVMDLWPAADWHERETYDMLGVTFEGRDELRRILLPEDWVGYPLRKDYEQPDEYHGITHW